MKKFLSFLFVYSILILSASAKDIRFIQVADLRYTNSSAPILATLVAEINKQKDISFVVFTGDNINKPNKEDLDGFLKEAKKLKAPFYMVAGDRDLNKRKELGKKEYFKYIHKKVRAHKSTPNYIFEKNGMVFIVADGSKDVIHDTVGFYKDNVLEWVDANLDLYSKKNVIIFQHFPLIPPAEKEMYYTYKPEKYLEILDNHKNVKAVISGHFGINKEIERNGVNHISTAPVPYYRIFDITDCDSSNPTIWAELKQVNE